MRHKIVLFVALLVSMVDFPPPVDSPEECREGAPGCICDGTQGECRDVPEPATTCAECITEEECNDLCEVGPCDSCEQVGCWIPDHLECEVQP